MFKKKESAPKPPAAVQFLTPDYSIEGYLDDLDNWPFDVLMLTSVRFEPTGALTPSASTAANWVLFEKSPVVAAIPRDEASLAYTKKMYRDYKYPLPAEIYVGSYLIQGMIMRMIEDTDPSSLAVTLDEYVLVEDAVIDCLLPGARLKRLSAPLAVVCTDRLLQGLVLLQ